MASKLPGGAVARWAVPRLAYLALDLTHRSIRWRWDGEEVADATLRNPAPFIIAFWHSRIPMMTPLLRKVGRFGRDGAALISNNRDGEMIADVARRFGGSVIHGSTRNEKKTNREKGGGAALRGGLAHLHAGGALIVTPDGPRGPRQRAQAGASIMAAQTGAAVLPTAFSVAGGKTVRSWDRMLLPYPFTRGLYVVGAPIPAPEDTEAAIEAHRLSVEAALERVTRRADAAMGRDTPEQGKTGQAER